MGRAAPTLTFMHALPLPEVLLPALAAWLLPP